MGLFVAGEGRRYYGRTTTASMPHRTVMTVRQPVGVAGLIISFNTPLPNVAWKVFPALLCGNGAVLKPSEETPALRQPLRDNLPRGAASRAGVLNVVQGLGSEAGAALVEHPASISSASRARPRRAAGSRRRRGAGWRRSASSWAARTRSSSATTPISTSPCAGRSQSAFSNAGQRCAAASRIVVFDAVYEEFRARFVEAAQAFEDTGR